MIQNPEGASNLHLVGSQILRTYPALNPISCLSESARDLIDHPSEECVHMSCSSQDVTGVRGTPEETKKLEV